MEHIIKRVVFSSERQVQCETVRANLAPADDGVIVETRYSCISAGTELAKLTGKQSFRFPSGIGNRAVGRVVEAGAHCSRARPGDLVFAHTPHCSLAASNGLFVRLPDDLDRPEGALIGLASVAMTGVRVACPDLGDTAVVLGAGLVGQFTAQLLAINGMRVIIVDQVAQRLEIARGFGVETLLDARDGSMAGNLLRMTSGAGADHVFDCTGDPGAIVAAPALARRGGKIIMVGSPRGAFCADITGFLNAFHLDGPHGDLTLCGAHEWKIPLWQTDSCKHSQERNIRVIARLALDGRLKLAPLLSRVFKPEDAAECYGALSSGHPALLGVVFDWRGGLGK